MSCLVLEPRGALGLRPRGRSLSSDLEGQTAPGKRLCIRAFQGWGEVRSRGDELQRSEHSGVRRRPEPISSKREGKGKCQGELKLPTDLVTWVQVTFTERSGGWGWKSDCGGWAGSGR